jgi:sugar phosphate isomerase/epimerase
VTNDEKEYALMISRRELILGAPASLAAASAWPALARAAGEAKNPVACQTNAWQLKPGDFAELLHRLEDLKRLGFEAFECNVRFVKTQFTRTQEARAAIEKTGVGFYGTHVGLGVPMNELEGLTEGVAALGATRFVLSGAGKSLTSDGQLDQDALNRKVESIMQLARRCQRAGLRLAYHNHRTEFLQGGDEIEALLARTDPELVYFLLDIGHAYVEKADVPAFLTRDHRRIDALHVRDIRGEQQVPLGEGNFDFAALAAAIKKTSWPGYLTLEEENLKTNDAERVETVLRSSRQIIRKAFGV